MPRTLSDISGGYPNNDEENLYITDFYLGKWSNISKYVIKSTYKDPMTSRFTLYILCIKVKKLPSVNNSSQKW